MAAPATKWNKPNVLKKRALTALVLMPLTAAAVLWLPTAVLAFVFGLLALAAGWEWAALSGWRSHRARAVYVIALAMALVGAQGWMLHESGVWAGLILGLGAWLTALLWLTRPDFRAGRTLKSLVGLLLLGCAWMSVIWMHGLNDRGPLWALYLLALIWVADSGAYFAGRRFGRRKLAPRISPGKTWEGVYGALVATLVYAWAVAEWMPVAPVWPFVALSIFAVAISVAGDLFESLLKRQAGVKDSGAALPGHGGVLDRVDGLLAAAPVFLAGAMIWVLP